MSYNSGLALQQLEQDGYHLVQPILSRCELDRLRQLVAALGEANSRGVEKDVPAIEQLAYHKSISPILDSIMGAKRRLIRVIYFNKQQTNNWPVAWHQDKTIVVDDNQSIEELGQWQQLKGRYRLTPELSMLKSMLTLRIHLDDAYHENGCLQVVPKSHKLGILNQQQVEQAVKMQEKVNCPLAAGGIMLMRPLLLHKSGRNRTSSPRRVLHLEFATLQQKN